MHTIHVIFFIADNAWLIEVESAKIAGNCVARRKFTGENNYNKASDFLEGVTFALRAANVKYVIENSSN